jgi:hypothetical protein
VDLALLVNPLQLLYELPLFARELLGDCYLHAMSLVSAAMTAT